MEPNPRSMKRLLNTFSILRALLLSKPNNIDHDALALWTIANLRWPELCVYLAKEPNMINEIGKHISVTVPETIEPLFLNQGVMDVFEGRHKI